MEPVAQMLLCLHVDGLKGGDLMRFNNFIDDKNQERAVLLRNIFCGDEADPNIPSCRWQRCGDMRDE